jgi:hypothetical protein
MPLSTSRNFDPVGENCFISSLVHCFPRSNDARLLLKSSQLLHFDNEPISFLQGSWVLSNRPISAMEHLLVIPGYLGRGGRAFASSLGFL